MSLKAERDDELFFPIPALLIYLRGVRVNLNLTQEAVGRRMGTVASEVSRLECGGINTHLRTVGRYARALGTPVTEFGLRDPRGNAAQVFVGPGIADPFLTPGSQVPGRPWMVTGFCGHAVDLAEWEDGFTACEDCPLMTGRPVPGREGYLTGRCGHAVARSKWRLGVRVCDGCSNPERVPA